jgi:ferredoxin
MDAFTLVFHPQRWTVRARAGQSVLSAVIAAGFAPPYSCRLGYCGACRARLLSGVIEYPSGLQVRAQPGAPAAEEVMLCIARARSDLELELAFPPQRDAENPSVASRSA